MGLEGDWGDLLLVKGTFILFKKMKETLRLAFSNRCRLFLKEEAIRSLRKKKPSRVFEAVVLSKAVLKCNCSTLVEKSLEN